MAFKRSIETKTCEAALACFQADPDATQYWRRMFIGPWVGTESSINTPQLAVNIAPGLTYAPGISGAAVSHIALIVVTFEVQMTGPFRTGTLSPICRLRHLQKLVTKGSFDQQIPGYDPNGGRLIDPDNPTSTDSTVKYLSVTSPEFRDLVPQRMKSVDVYGFLATFETRQDNITRARA